MKYVLLNLIIIIIIIIVYENYNKIPSKANHINRNKYNILPVGQLKYIEKNKYVDNAGIIWIKRTFLQSIFHNPFIYYIFETHDANKIASSEVKILKKDFDNNYHDFKSSTYNYYSSMNDPISHLFADVIPILIYIF